MNQKKPYPSDWRPEFLYEFDVASTGKTFRVTRGTWVSVSRRTGLMAGQYEVLYAERTKDGTLLIQAEGPLSRARRRKIIRESDIKTVHVKTRPRPFDGPAANP
jgi:hypothetical protein